MTPPGLNRSMRRTDESTAGGLTLRQGELLHGGELDPLCVRGAPFDGFGAVLRKSLRGYSVRCRRETLTKENRENEINERYERE